MKTIFYKLRITLILITFTLNNFAQVDISINAEYLNNQISNCNDIDLNLNNAHYISLNIHMEKFYDQYNYNNVNDIATSGIIHIKLDPLDKLTIPIESSDWNTNSSLTKDIVNRTVLITIYNEELDDNWNNDILYATYENGSVSYGDTYSCPFTITRPHYYLSPSSTTIPCSSTYPKYFSVSNSNDSPGNVIYQWSVGSGWLHNGISESNFDTTSSNISLTPTSYPPSDVHVTPVLDGVSYGELTSNVSLSEFNPDVSITGANINCSSATYSINNIPNDWNVNWSVSNTNGTITPINNHQASLSISGNGSLIIYATITNSCNQTYDVTPKSIHYGRPNTASVIYGPTRIIGDSFVRYSTNAIHGATSYEWRVPYPYSVVSNLNTYSRTWLMSNNNTDISIDAYTGTEGRSGYVQVWGKNICGKGGAKILKVSGKGSSQGGPHDGQIKTNSYNSFDYYFELLPNPAKDNLTINNLNRDNIKIHNLLFTNFYGKVIKIIDIKDAKTIIDVSKIPNGIYIMKLILTNKTLTQKIIISH